MKIASIKTRINLGVFILCVSIVGLICLIIAGDELSLFKRSRHFKSYFANTSGLIEGAPIRIGGVEVGRVAKIMIEPRDEKMSIAATLKIENPYYDLISNDATIGLDTQGLLGDKFLALNPGTDTSRGPLEEGDVIRTREVEGIARMVEKSGDIMDDISKTVRKINEFTSSLPDQAAISGAGNDFTQSARSLRILMDKLSANDSFLSTLNDAQSKALLKKSLVSLESAAAHADSITQKIDSGQGTIGALINDRTVYEDLRSMLGHIDRGKIARRVFIESVSKDKELPKK